MVLLLHQHLRAGLRQNKSNLVLFGLPLFRTLEREPAREMDCASVVRRDLRFSWFRPRSSVLAMDSLDGVAVPDMEVERSPPVAAAASAAAAFAAALTVLLFKRASVNEKITVLPGSSDRWPQSSS